MLRNVPEPEITAGPALSWPLTDSVPLTRLLELGARVRFALMLRVLPVPTTSGLLAAVGESVLVEAGESVADTLLDNVRPPIVCVGTFVSVTGPAVVLPLMTSWSSVAGDVRVGVQLVVVWKSPDPLKFQV